MCSNHEFIIIILIVNSCTEFFYQECLLGGDVYVFSVLFSYSVNAIKLKGVPYINSESLTNYNFETFWSTFTKFVQHIQ